MINFLLLVSRQGKTRLSKWYDHYPTKEKARIIRELTTLVLARPPKMCNFIEWRDKKVMCGWLVVGWVMMAWSGGLGYQHQSPLFFHTPSIPPHPIRAQPQVVYKRYASLFFIAVVDAADNELITLEVGARRSRFMHPCFACVVVGGILQPNSC